MTSPVFARWIKRPLVSLPHLPSRGPHIFGKVRRLQSIDKQAELFWRRSVSDALQKMIDFGRQSKERVERKKSGVFKLLRVLLGNLISGDQYAGYFSELDFNSRMILVRGNLYLYLTRTHSTAPQYHGSPRLQELHNALACMRGGKCLI